MTDMRIEPKSDQLNADDLWGSPRTVTITKVSACASAEQPIAVEFDGDDGRPYKPCKSMRRVMVAMWGKDAVEYTGRSMTLYRDPDVTWGGMKVGGIRISHMSHIERETTMALTATKQSRKPFTVKPLKAAAPQPKERESPPPAGTPDKSTEAYDRFKAALDACDDLASLADLQTKLGKGNKALGDHYQECALALQAKQQALMTDKGHHDAFDEMEDDEWKQQEGRVDDERAGELPV